MSERLTDEQLGDIASWYDKTQTAASSMATELLALRARVAKLETVLRECADELEEHVEARYAKTKPHLERQYERDIDPVRQAREALKDTPQ